MGIAKRKAIYVEYAQAVPLKYAIDPKECIYLTKGKCGACKKICPADAINFDEKEKNLTLNVGAVVISPGFSPYDPTKFDNYQYSKLPNVMTAMEYERILSASGPTKGHLVRPSDHKEPKKIAWFQCVGSRDLNKCDNSYCSSVCCMYAIKEAVISKEHAGKGLDCAIFFMDIRTHGKDFEKYYENAKNKHGVRFIRSRVHTITPIPNSDDLEIRYIKEDGELVVEAFDMIVLSVGLATSPETVEFAKTLDIKLTEGKFCETTTFEPVNTSRKGIYVAGAFQGPKDIPQSIIEASAGASAAGEILTPSRNTLTKVKEFIPEINVINDRPRIGVFVCRCGINIASVVDVPGVAEYAKTLPYVEFVTDNLFSCSQDTQNTIASIMKEKNLNRIVVAACTPKTHEPLFQETLSNAGLNKYLFEMANIRNQDSWVHKSTPELATEKAKDLVRMAVVKVALTEPLKEAELAINQTALVIGGGISGMVAAKSLSKQGYVTHILERSDKLGGQALSLFKTGKEENIQNELSKLVDDVKKDKNIQIHLKTDISKVDGFVGNFKTVLSSNGKDEVLEHGVTIMATGAAPIIPEEYQYGKDPRIITNLDLDKKFITNDPMLKTLKTAIFIQCVGSREPNRMYCSRLCCTNSVLNALELKKINPEMNVFILYRDMRTYGEKELLYKKARKEGVIFIRYTLNEKPRVVFEEDELAVIVKDHVLSRPIMIKTDLLSLAPAIVPYADDKLAKFFKVPLNEDGFFVERHAKLGPSEFATDGVFLCGLAHYPKPIDESIAHAKAAASRAVTLLAKKKVYVSGQIAAVQPANCSSCGVCISICAFSAPSFVEKGPFTGKAEINPVLCKGCGLCVSSCRSGAIRLKGFDNDQIFSQIFAIK